MFSLIDAFLDQPLIVALQELPFPTRLKTTLLGEKSKFREVYDLILFYEKGEWEKIRAAAEKLRLGEEEVVEAYAKTLDMTNKIFIS